MYQQIYKAYIESFHKQSQKVNYKFSDYELFYNRSNLYKMNSVENSNNILY